MLGWIGHSGPIDPSWNYCHQPCDIWFHMCCLSSIRFLQLQVSIAPTLFYKLVDLFCTSMMRYESCNRKESRKLSAIKILRKPKTCTSYQPLDLYLQTFSILWLLLEVTSKLDHFCTKYLNFYMVIIKVFFFFFFFLKTDLMKLFR